MLFMREKLMKNTFRFRAISTNQGGYCPVFCEISLLKHPIDSQNRHSCRHLSCNQFCPNHYSAIRPTPHQRLPPGFTSSLLLAAAGSPANTRLFEISATIPPPPPFQFYHDNHTRPSLKCSLFSHPSPSHTDAFIQTPELPPRNPTYTRTKPSPQTFPSGTTTDILPYTSLRIRHPPETPTKLPSSSNWNRGMFTPEPPLIDNIVFFTSHSTSTCIQHEKGKGIAVGLFLPGSFPESRASPSLN